MSDSHTSRPDSNLQMVFVGLICLLGLSILVMMSVRKSPETSAPAPKPFVDASDPVIATLGDDPITQGEIDLARVYFGADLSDNKILERLAQQKLFTKLSEDLDIGNEPQIQRRLRFASERILSERAVEVFMKDRVSDAEINEFYEKEKVKFSGQSQIKARQIVLPDAATAAEIVRRLENGESFASLALAFSQDRASREAGGDLGYMSRDVQNEILTDKVFAANDGDRLNPFQTSQGWHIVEVISRRPYPMLSLDERRPAIRKLISSQKLATKLENLREDNPLKIINASE